MPCFSYFFHMFALPLTHLHMFGFLLAPPPPIFINHLTCSPLPLFLYIPAPFPLPFLPSCPIPYLYSLPHLLSSSPPICIRVLALCLFPLFWLFYLFPTLIC